MQEFSNIYNSLSEESFDSLLENYVVVTEKLSGSSFSFQFKNGKLNFYKGNKSINLVDRTLINYYEDAINHISSITENIDNNLRFSFQYFVNDKPGLIRYDSLPINKLVLTHISEMSDSDKILNIKSDVNILKKWANRFNVSFIKPIYEGYLTKEHIKFLKSYLSLSYDDMERNNMFERRTFAHSIFNVFDFDAKKSMLQESLNRPIEGVVFSFLGENNHLYKTKLLDPYTVQSIKKRKEDYKKFNADINEVILVDILSFINERGLLLNQLISSDNDERYIELISKIFNDYVDVKGDIKDIQIEKAEFANGPEFDLNLDLIKNEKTKENINKSDSHKSLFKIMLGSLRKKRNPNKEGNVMTKTMVNEFNNLVDEIEKGISEEPEEFKTFMDFISNGNEEESTIEEMIIEEKVLKVNEFINLGKIKF